MTYYATYPSLRDRVVLITGGATGIGAALVEHFCAQQSHVAFLDIDENSAINLISNIQQKYNLTPRFKLCDIRDINALRKAIQDITRELGNIRVLINNAANDQRHKTLEVNEQQWQDIMALNLNHHFFAAQAVIPGMIKAGGGSIINMSSNCFILAQAEDYPGYMTAKSAIIGLTRALAKEFGSYNIRINSLLPGWVMTERQISKWLNPEAEQELIKTQSLKEKIYPDDIARFALFLAADDSKMCTKQTFIIDGGRV